MQPRFHSAIPELVSLFELPPTGQGRSQTTSKTTLRLRALVQDFRDTEQYTALKRLTQVVSHTHEWTTHAGSKPLGSLLRRYPCLYDHSLLTKDSTSEQRQQIRKIRQQVQQQFERDLSRYAAYKLIGDNSLANPAMTAVINAGERSRRNPTLLSDRHLDRALQQFGGKVDGSNTYRDLAQCFLTYSSQAHTYRIFKNDLYDYLTASIDVKYGKSQFNQRLYTYLQGILPDQDDQCLSDVLLVCTCRKLLNFLTVEGCQDLNHANFVDLTGNLGATATVGLLLKIVLICRNVKPYLEKRFAILFNHYETSTRDGVVWLIESLESLNVAFSINFGTLILSKESKSNRQQTL
ncbi:MAG: hypothetical protein HC772_17330 [Leptolyngbyaceae cyanobacterium CRU_2_3]|nr:hypothetical protein [Leptolyngbyaceae cyanobacterium CRU_2_3]